jgi:hypothetical protein
MPTLPFRKDGHPYGGSLRDGSRVVGQTGNLIEDVSSPPDFAVALDHRPAGSMHSSPSSGSMMLLDDVPAFGCLHDILGKSRAPGRTAFNTELAG